jgi:DNA topoisomerase-2
MWVLNPDKHFTKQNVQYSPASLKILDEVLVNAIDRNSMFPDQVKYIKVLVDRNEGLISIENNGPLGGICVKENETEKIMNPELTFGHLLTSTNYNDEEERVVGGRNGYGAKLANIYSSKFVVIIKDGENHLQYSQTWENNMSVCNKAHITKYRGKESSVNIVFQPDWKLFGMSSMSEDFFNIVEKRVYDAAVCTSPNCKVYFQGEVVPSVTLEKYARMYLDTGAKIATYQTERWSVVVSPSDNGFNQVSFVNGICTTKGGTHVDYVSRMVCDGIIEKLGKKVKLQPQHVKTHFFIFVRATLVNPSFSSQIKSECTLKAQNFGSTLAFPPTFAQQVLKTGLQDDLLALSRFREQKELKKTDSGAKRSKISGIPKLDDANNAGTAKSSQCTLIITEGDSAKALAIAGLSKVGRDNYGVFPLRGKCKNVREASVKQLLANQEFSDLKKILGLQQEKVYTSLSELRYGRLMIMTDADHDGSHIKGLVLNMIHYFWPSLLDLGFCVSMVTPIIKASRGKESRWFFTESSFKRFDPRGWKIKYYKGLGTSTSTEAREYFEQLARLTVKFDNDPMSQEAIVLAFDKNRADARKGWLVENARTDPLEKEIEYGNVNELAISEFVHRDLVNFSLADLRRSIPHMCDGLKPSQRKVMFACFKKNLKDEMKVAQLAAYVSEKTSYHHGEVSLADTIVKLAHDYMGSNNVNYLEPCGQFGTRLMGGKDASQTRYIFTRLTPAARQLFDSRDDPVLNYLMDDGNQIEPEFYVPVIPTILVNGSEGIGTGFSCNIPPYNPTEIVASMTQLLKGKTPTKLKPWYKGFKGHISEGETEGTWTATGVYLTNGNSVKVNDLPPTRWTQDYKEYLETLVEKKVISGYKNNSKVDSVDFEIFGYMGHDIHRDLKLTKTIHTTNMHMFHPTRGITKYNTPEEILMDFLEVRIQYYKKRKEHMVADLTRKKRQLDNKARFVRMVVEEEIIIFKRKREELVKNLEAQKFDKLDDSYDYLLGIKTYQYTEEEIEKLNEEAVNTYKMLEQLKKTAVIQMYQDDLSNCSFS